MGASSPRDFLENPTGQLGAHNLCNPLWEPFKMTKTLGDEASDVRIIGYPQINWRGNPRSCEDLRNYINYAQAYTGHMVDWCARIRTACSKLGSSPPDTGDGKKRRRGNNQAPDHGELQEELDCALPVFYGLPVRLGAVSRYYQCITSYAPIFMAIRMLRVQNARETYTCFQLNFGGSPPILQCLFRSFLFHGRAGIDSAKLDRIYLEDLDVKWNLGMLEERFYGASSKHTFQFASAGCNMKSYRDLVRYIRSGVKDGSVSPFNAVQILTRHFELCWGLYVAMVDSGVFMSDRVTQTLRMLKKLYAVNARGENQFQETLHSFQMSLISKTPGDFIINPYDFAKRTILASLVHTNNAGQLLNSINLGTKLDIIISMLSYSIGTENKTLTSFGKGIEIAPCSGSARGFIPGLKGEPVTKIENPNGCGKDYAVIMVNQDHDHLLVHLKEQDNGNFKITVEQDFTKTAIVLRTCVQVVDGRVISTPDPTTNGMFTVLTEVRGEMTDQLEILITWIYPRGEKTEQLNTTTKEDPTSKAREVVNRFKVCNIHLLMRCTNTVIPNLKIQESYQTLLAVLHCRPPGTTLYNVGNSRPRGVGLCSAHINRYECRSRTLSTPDSLIAAFVHTAACLVAEHVGKMNQTMFPAEINPAVTGVLDWVLYVAQSNWESMFNFLCEGRRLNRLKRVYEARAAVMGLYAHTLNCLVQHEDYSTAMYKAALAFHCDPLPLSNCGDLLYTIIFRSLSWVPVIYSRCYAIETDIPVVPVDIMIQLFTAEQGPPAHGTELRRWYDEVAAWLTQCVEEHRFCLNPEGDSFSEYISSNGQLSGAVVENGVLRVSQEQNLWADSDVYTAPKAIARGVWEKFGKELAHTFALSETSMAAAIDEMLKTFEVGGKNLIGFDVCNIERHTEYFGLRGQLPFKGRQFSNERRPFAVRHTWAKVTCFSRLFSSRLFFSRLTRALQDDTRDPKAAYSVGFGLHWAQLLLLISFVGDSIGTNVHPQNISDLARTLSRLVLAQAPSAVTPGRFVEVPSFSCYDCSLEPIDMGGRQDRLEHFLRPQNEQLAIDGILPDCDNFQNFAVEDIIPIGALCSWARCIECAVWKVPAIADVTYNLRPDVLYVVYNQATGSLGSLEIGSSGVVSLEYNSGGEGETDTGKSLDLMSWQSELMELGFIVLPLITRPCACVSIGDEGHVGCLVPPDENASFNVSRVDIRYRAKTHVDTVQVMRVLAVMEQLLPIGTLCYLKMESQSAAPLIRRLNSPLSLDERRGRVLKMRLSCPNVKHPTHGRLYVVFVVRKGISAYGETMTVDPWEITTEKGNRSVIEHLSP